MQISNLTGLPEEVGERGAAELLADRLAVDLGRELGIGFVADSVLVGLDLLVEVLRDQQVGR